jgi:preprotein translocase subunit SecF
MSLRLFAKTNINFMRLRFLAFGLSILLTIGSIGLLATKGLNFGVDFTGGIVIEIRPEKALEISALRESVNEIAKINNLPEVLIQNIQNSNDFMIKIANKEGGDDERKRATEAMKSGITEKVGNVEFRKIDYVGPQIGGELIKSAILAVCLAFVGIFIYIWVRYEWQYSLFGIITLVHDIIIIFGFYSLTGIEFDSTSIAAVLTLIGYSLNDSVVIYDRIRENLRKFKKKELTDVINLSINETLSRTVLASGTTIASLTALLVFGGPAVFGFSVAVFAGVIFGTYSSIYVSAPGLILTGLKRD